MILTRYYWRPLLLGEPQTERYKLSFDKYRIGFAREFLHLRAYSSVG